MKKSPFMFTITKAERKRMSDYLYKHEGKFLKPFYKAQLKREIKEEMNHE